MELLKRLNDLLISVSKPCEMEPIGLPRDCMPWLSTWKAKVRHRLPSSLKFIVQKCANGSNVGKNMALKECWKDIGQDGQSVCPKNSAKHSRTFWTVVPLPMDSIPVFGHAQWYAGLLKTNFRSIIILRIYLKFCMSLTSPFSGPRKYLLGLIKHFNPDGPVINTPTLKKSQKRKSCDPLRRRSQLPARPHYLPNMGKGRLPAGNPEHGPTQYTKNIRDHRIILCTIPLPFSGCIQRPNLCRISRKDFTQLCASQNLSDPGQCFLSQRQRCLGRFSSHRKHIEVFNLPAYSPDLNALERIWHHTRLCGTHNRYFKTQLELRSILTSTFRSIQHNPRQVMGYLRPYQ